MGPSIGWNFSFCLVPTSAQKACKMHFGDGAVVSGAGVVTTPIVTKNTGTFYHLTLVGMSVGSQRFDSDSSKKSVLEGNIVIDSGTTLTFLPRDLYGKVEAALKQQVSLKQIEDPHKKMKLCYDVTNIKDAEAKIPEITVHFKGADVKLKAHNTFIMSTKKGIIMGAKNAMCLAFAPAGLTPIYGKTYCSTYFPCLNSTFENFVIH
ncbi:aspartic proteinase CDR1-like [Salvia splendens]|uniref:aspartic proteinase CDR1-like n=1 Tax=Salvia splendens TaxID=180675 RepID=UPI001C26BA7C|nr:aspartic proteinase CDR1-like [Salvia splendens]